MKTAYEVPGSIQADQLGSPQVKTTASPPAQKRVLILAGDTDANLGDCAILVSTIQEIRTVWPDARISIVSDRREVGVPDLRIIPRGRRGFLLWCREAVNSDLILCGGGGLFQDDDSLVKMPYWALRTMFAAILGHRVVGYSLGVGPLNARTSRLAARLAFAAMDAISVRDPLARDVAQPLTRKSVTVLPDPAILLSGANDAIVRSWMEERRIPLDEKLLIGVAPRRWFPAHPRVIPHKVRASLASGRTPLDPDSRTLAALIASVLERLVRRHNAHILLMPSYNAAHESDLLMAEEIRSEMTNGAVQILHVQEPSLYKGIAARTSLFIGGRMHPTIFASSTGTPVIGLAYNPKFHGFFSLLGREDQVMDVSDFFHARRVDELTDIASRALQGPAISQEVIAKLATATKEGTRSLLGVGS